MKRYLTLFIVSFIILGSALLGCAGAQPTPQSSSPSHKGDKDKPPQAEASRKDVLGSEKRVVLGFYTDLGSVESKAKQSVIKHIKAIDELAFFWYSFDGTGKVKNANVDLSIKEIAQKGGVKVYALVHNLSEKQFDPQVAHQVLANPVVRKSFINNLLALTTKENWDGITIDIEKISSADRNNYSTFIKELQSALKAKDKVLNVSIPAKYHDDPNDTWSGAFDYAAIGKAADEVVLMTYEEHGVGTTQGPIASQGWVNRVIEYATGKIPKEKIVIGLPVYASNWASNKPTSPTYISYAQANNLARKHKVSILYDETQQVPHYTFTDAGVRHEIYLENVRSLSAKLDCAKKNQLHGVAIWRLGIEDPLLWTDVLTNYG
ncbi:glycosyl hydrolase family 18 protein [Desulfosporosinus sp. OT]|uniref:glycosyl hydrolase family 18 protein n=1 Tax=Desulfosporosinus sp. OT TaxID=913865 RepID=UPI000223A5FA|nr:glycosyl hydrolase family 18 protein [Desulfosporosinus sp. OT]EGW39148.1 glycosyl hydrolases 18 family protein [Desulfosporosinus sp. OT]